MAILGLDIGGTGIKGALVDVQEGTLCTDRFRLPTPQPAIPEAVAHVVKQIADHFHYAGPAGITFPGVVKEGVIYTAVNLEKSWIHMDGKLLFTREVNGPVEMVNDADAAGIAEMQFGAGRDQEGVVILLTFGTGIGSAIFVNGKLVPNTEFGHLKIREKDAEQRASERAREKKQLSWKDWSVRASEFLAELEKLFSPDLFIIGGGVSRKAEKFIPYLLEKSKVRMVAAEMENRAGIVGAAYQARRFVESE